MQLTAPVMITGPLIEELKVVMLLLQPLDNATTQLSGQTYSTSSIVIPLIYNLERSISSVDTSAANYSDTA